MERYDVIVLGLGAMGSAALYDLARRGVRALGIERHGVAHGFGSSHGVTRVIRKAYFEHPNYIPLLNRAYENWTRLQEESGEPLFVPTGLLVAGPPDSAVIEGLSRCYAEHDLPHERLNAMEAMARHPQFALPRDYAAFFDPSGGYLLAEECIEHSLRLAEERGAEVLLHEETTAWKADSDGVRVFTEHGEYEAGALVVTAGPWSADALRELNLPLSLRRKVQLWYATPDAAPYSEGAMPVFYVAADYGGFYGFPARDEDGLKLAEHTGGDPLDNPDTLNRGLEPQDEEKALRFLAETLPGFEPERRRFSVCMYTMTPDEHFIIDRHPEHPNVALAAGFSGHGFKFASVVGEILADLATEGRTDLPVDFLSLGRFRGAMR